ncbi:hypothetical protein SAMN05421819_3390 [Bryocella elongata]|uniref:Uncharacterized protein n=1 Tax=Bryocella elongata TaxID=863522 RepID=A0A1H6AZ86_9BACT|nr:hypothetical protein [Bryocella elongata]SEG53929.1 hypothetical protein SAMN05421819_3390 [Bryocella elongata]
MSLRIHSSTIHSLLVVLLLASAFMRRAEAQGTAVPQPDATLGAALRSLASRAGVVFVGQVTQVERTGEVVLVHFRVDQQILGDAPSSFVLREWAGLWPNGEQRYYPGLRAMFFLHAASGSGFSSPVDGADGVVPAIPQGAEAIPLLDTRRLDARLQRSVGNPLPDASVSAVLLTEAASLVQGWQAPVWTEPVRRPLPVEAIPSIVSTDPGTGAPIRVHRLQPSVPKPQPPQPDPVATSPSSRIAPIAYAPR